MIKITNLRKRFGDRPALEGVSFHVREGRITGLLGANGAGKTTLISICTGIVDKDRGTVVIDGLDLDRDLPRIKSRSAVVPQTLAFYPTLTCAENLRFFGGVLGLHGDRLRRRISFAGDACGLHEEIGRASV